MDELPLRDDLRGRTAYGAPQLDVPVRLNTNENPYPPSDALAADLAGAVGEAALTLNRYPDRDAIALRAELAGYLGHGPDGRSGLGGQRLQRDHPAAAAGLRRAGPHRDGLRAVATRCTASSPQATGTGWISGYREDDFTLDADRVLAQIAEHSPDVVFLTSPNNPTGTALPLDGHRGRVRRGRRASWCVDEAYAEFARDGVPAR